MPSSDRIEDMKKLISQPPMKNKIKVWVWKGDFPENVYNCQSIVYHELDDLLDTLKSELEEGGLHDVIKISCKEITRKELESIPEAD
ncbi:MAG: hypothetical protein IPP74_14705 [Alphaproteobacteria bacterium]|nr:hypothetical protein [Alphaproteobacteria bacterium]